jgi:hypothetical protein
LAAAANDGLAHDIGLVIAKAVQGQVAELPKPSAANG